MKNRIMSVVVVALMLAPGWRALHAEEPGMYEAKSGEWKKNLSLSDEQSKQLKELHESEKAELKPLRDKKHELIGKLEGQVKNKAAETEIKATLDELAANRESMENTWKKFEKSSDAILTPTQQAKKFLAMMKHHDKMGKMKKQEKGEKGEHKEHEAAE